MKFVIVDKGKGLVPLSAIKCVYYHNHCLVADYVTDDIYDAVLYEYPEDEQLWRLNIFDEFKAFVREV